jgi:hypothetical protein
MRASDDYALDSTRQDAGLSAQGECQCGLPTSVWAHKSQMLTLLELEIDTAKTMVFIDHVCVCMDGADKTHDRRERDSVSETTRASKLIVRVGGCAYVRVRAGVVRASDGHKDGPQRSPLQILGKREDTFKQSHGLHLHSLSQHRSELDAERVVWISSTAS